MKLSYLNSIFVFLVLCMPSLVMAQGKPTPIPPARPWAITGTKTVCVGSTTVLVDTNGGGTGIWNSSDTLITTISNGTVTGVNAGTATISYTYVDASFAMVTDWATVTVNPLPQAGTIAGNTFVCNGANTILTDSVQGGSWSSSDNSIANVDGEGVASGLATGAATISYSITNSCGTAFTTMFFTVTSGTAPITSGSGYVCAQSTMNLYDDSTGGTWTSGNTGIAAIDAGSGMITGISAGSVSVTYTLGGGCYATTNVIVNPLPNAGSISGGTTLSKGGNVALFDVGASTPGTWSSCNALIAAVDGSGDVYGIANGNTLISYTVTNSCGTAYATADIIVGSCTTANTISTFTGSHVNGNTGDGGTATAAQTGSSYGVVADAFDNVYISDYNFNVVRKVDPSGNITTIAGTGIAGYNGDTILATSAQLNGPQGMALDGAGNLYIADKFNDRIRKINLSTGIITSIAGTGHHGGWQGYGSGNGGPATAANLDFPAAVAVDCGGNVYIADWGSQTVRKIDPTGTINNFAGTYGAGYNGDGIQATSAQLNSPSGVAADCNGNVYIADSWNNRVRKVGSDGIITTIAGNGIPGYSGDGSPGGSAELWIPNNITLDACGDLYIADWQNNVVRFLNYTPGPGNNYYISTFAGKNDNDWHGYDGDGGPADSAYLYLPSSVAIDGSGNVYIADWGNYVVRAIGNSLPAARHFANGTTQDMTVCANEMNIPINNLLAIPDETGEKTEIWSVGVQPLHGTLSGFSASAPSRIGITTPGGLTYTPEAGYTGNDVFTVVMNDGITAASTTINVKVYQQPSPGTITGVTNTTLGTNITLADVNGDANGIWSSSNDQVATIDASGNVTGTGNGIVTISYTVTNGCGSKSATTGVVITNADIQASKTLLFPNPNNGNFQCEFTSETNCTLELIVSDVTSRIVYKQNIDATAGTNVVNVNLPADIERPSLLTVSVGKYPAVKINVTE